mgnify:CR=1 FL=1
MNPLSNIFDEPGISIIVEANCPPVHDSAEVSIKFILDNLSTTFLANLKFLLII